MSRIAVFLIVTISHFFRTVGIRACRFHPTCSRYAIDAFHEFSFFAASWLVLKRILRCQPFSAGGFDPVSLQRNS
jgi:putative membrane protein insertion efficiency factor